MCGLYSEEQFQISFFSKASTNTSPISPFASSSIHPLPGGSSTTKTIASNFEWPSETILNRLILMVLGKRLRQSIYIEN